MRATFYQKQMSQSERGVQTNIGSNREALVVAWRNDYDLTNMRDWDKRC